MKKILLFLLVTFVSLSFTAQEFEGPKENRYPEGVEKKNELKLNAFNLIAFAALDISYEKVISANSSYGVGIF
jgi:hypothetical protein